MDEKKDKFDEMIRSACLRGSSEAELEEKSDVHVPKLVRDPSGVLLCPGHPKLCLGSGKFGKLFECCCDECNYFLQCFPEWAPGGSAWKEEKEDLLRKHGIIVDPTDDEKDDEEERYYTLLRYKCKHCGFELERRYKSPADFKGGMVTCTCGAFSFDPHPLWPQLSWQNGVDPHVDLEEYFEEAPIP